MKKYIIAGLLLLITTAGVSLGFTAAEQERLKRVDAEIRAKETLLEDDRGLTPLERVDAKKRRIESLKQLRKLDAIDREREEREALWEARKQKNLGGDPNDPEQLTERIVELEKQVNLLLRQMKVVQKKCDRLQSLVKSLEKTVTGQNAPDEPNDYPNEIEG